MQNPTISTNKIFNWAGNYQYSTGRIHYPNTLEQLQQLVLSCQKLKVIGTRHSFNGIGDSHHNLVSLSELEPEIMLHNDHRSVTVGAGVRYGQLCEFLQRHKLALRNLGSLPHISVGGACVTATHGSGKQNGILATSVSAIEVMKADGDVMVISRYDANEDFLGSVVNLGALGVVTRLTLDVEPAFEMKQIVYQHLPFDALKNNYDAILTAAYSVSVFTDWKKRNFNQVWIKAKADDIADLATNDFYGARPATKNLHPIIELDSENCTQQLRVPGPWHERLPHFRMNFTPSSGDELQSEYFVPYDAGWDAIESIFKIAEQICPYLQISELRTVAADNFWMSPCYQRTSLAIHFTWTNDPGTVSKLIPLIEEKLSAFDVRSHWGKLFALSPQEFLRIYKKLPDFRQLSERYDPDRKFRNHFLDKYVFHS